MTLKPGDAVYFEPDSHVIRGPHGQIVMKEELVSDAVQENPENTDFDEGKYPEEYLKTDSVKGPNNAFCIGYVVNIFYKGIMRKLDFKFYLQPFSVIVF